MRFDQQRREGAALPFAAADRERAERDAVIALPPGDEILPLRLAALDEILPRELERRFDRLRSAADKENVADAFRRMRDEIVGEFFGGLRGEKAGMRIFELVELRPHGGENIGMRVAKAGHRRAAGGIDVFLAGLVADVDPLTRDSHRIVVPDRAMQNMGHLRRRPFARGNT